MREVLVRVKDDLTGEVLDETAGDRTRCIGVDGEWIEIDLTAAHSQQLDDLLAPFLKAGRPLKGGKKLPTHPRATESAPKPARPRGIKAMTHERRPGYQWRTRVRRWARDTDHAGARDNDRGRLSDGLVADYIAAHPDDPPPAGQPVFNAQSIAAALAQEPVQPAPEPAPDGTDWRARVRAWARETHHPCVSMTSFRKGLIPAQMRADYIAANPGDEMPAARARRTKVNA